MRTVQIILWFFLIAIAPLAAQDAHDNMNDMMPSMPGMSMGSQGATSPEMTMESHSLITLLQNHATAGTGAEPNSTPFEMLMATKGKWTFMFHGTGFLTDIQQTGPRGADKLFSTNWIMPMAQRKLGNGTLTLRTMLSLEPATISQRQFPELFQQGETAFGRPIVDGQHPHDFFMELAALYDYKLSDNTMLSFYGAPMGDPAMGPVAYPHRASASEDPLASLGHHLQDSTHISDDVVTAGIAYRNARLEASGFHGREPDEHRWDLDSGKIDSWSTRVTVNPGQNWSVQYSIAQMHSPEALAPAEDLRRMTASVMYNLPLHNGNLASLLLWGRNQSLFDGNVGNGYLLESTLRFENKNRIWTRIENVDRTNELLLGENPLPPGFTEKYFVRVQAYTAGYDREVGNIPHLSTAIGGQFTWYGVPDILRQTYGAHLIVVALFLHVWPH
ncbi:MAG TPA: hypothetical protein VGN39_05425 [Terriglobales bacterium]|jgi:hypothetical protein|nr:hypothetical protein [Terriglobales bacterium]